MTVLTIKNEIKFKLKCCKMYNISLLTMESYINIKFIINIQLMDIALLLVVNCKSDIKIDRTLCNYMTQLFNI